MDWVPKLIGVLIVGMFACGIWDLLFYYPRHGWSGRYYHRNVRNRRYGRNTTNAYLARQNRLFEQDMQNKRTGVYAEDWVRNEELYARRDFKEPR